MRDILSDGGAVATTALPFASGFAEGERGGDILVRAGELLVRGGGRIDASSFIDGPGETAQGKKLAVRFKDGELLCGYSLSFSPARDGFFMFPADSSSNNMRIYVVTAACAEVKAGPAAEQMALKSLPSEAA